MAKRKLFIALLTPVLLIAITSYTGFSQEPWKAEQLLAPSALASLISHKQNVPLIISIGPGALIRGSIDIGPAHEPANLDKLKAFLAKQDKNKAVVLYCGCCPFKNCPNIRPAFSLLNELKFSNSKLLDLAHNIKVDWLNQGYPVQETK